ncbi:4-hydroxythreonine-4-phosphate dehydrogenase PdxA [Brevibacterium sp. RIT 803]|uniref:4-hydroxythreonine-4-phosphate dehydrogenase PdxA n=1 Tax=Brevibacterium sp. RIT 803 TaxID=2810210 RepID=UPI00194E623B|nr:4-hydroxythreonine-4-phosphate dehydrogenase PdxA [Brevibacterium sp. RIT 803]MBM6590762.1 4-hydroxythreonine-4-phosphate dehydrogenase PdxA [Brevibacterium sp. RIT 803]
MPASDPGVLILADDLSGAAEAAATLGTPVRILLTDWSGRPTSPESAKATPQDVALDLDCRYLTPVEAASRTRSALETLRTENQTTIIKVDSLLRGNVRAHLTAALESTNGPVIFAPALPQHNRTVIGGVPYIDGKRLADTRAWNIEDRSGPDSLNDLCPEAPTLLELNQLRTSSPHELAARFRSERLITADAETMDDIGQVIALAASTGATVVGSAALVRAIADGRPLRRSAPLVEPPTALSAPVLFVLGTAADRIDGQVAHLQAHAQVGVLDIPATEVSAWNDNPDDLHVTASEIRNRLTCGNLVIRLTDTGDSVDPRPLPGLLAELVARSLTDIGPVHLAATGGETARAVLDRLGVGEVVTMREIHPGAVLSQVGTTSARPGEHSELGRVVTRPGGQGDEDSLTRIHEALTHGTAPTPITANTVANHEGERMTSRPTVAVTMGDGAGVGPEICVAACLDPTVLEVARPVVIGDAARLEQAAEILGVSASIRVIDSPAAAEDSPGVIDVIDLGLLPSDLEWGKLSDTAGDAAFRYIERASQLAMAGEVQAICTAPLNKEALHSAGHQYPGHTEMLAALTGTEEVSMMLSSPKLRVIHVTTHIGLIDAVATIEPGLVERTVRRGNDALIRAGIERPHIGVCAINPHAGENGLFGYGEEAEKITPAITALQGDGIDAVGPLSADTAFFLAGRGDYDLIVAMYHDQGHGPIKVLGIDAGVNITVGLPVIRTSVDHGTAFDIAGTGTVDTESMSEAMRQAATLATV